MPKRTTTEFKQLIGSEKPKQQVEAAPLNAQPADGLDEIAAAEWHRICESFDDRLTELDETLLALYCAAFSRWKRAEHSVKEQGEVISIDVRDTHGSVISQKPVVNPMVKVAESAARATHKYGESLGFSPAARVKQGYQHRPKVKNKVSAWQMVQAKKATNNNGTT